MNFLGLVLDVGAIIYYFNHYIQLWNDIPYVLNLMEVKNYEIVRPLLDNYHVRFRVFNKATSSVLKYHDYFDVKMLSASSRVIIYRNNVNKVDVGKCEGEQETSNSIYKKPDSRKIVIFQQGLKTFPFICQTT